jgi:hypothetical protein
MTNNQQRRTVMQEFKQAVGHILIMQMLVVAVLADRWVSEE